MSLVQKTYNFQDAQRQEHSPKYCLSFQVCKFFLEAVEKGLYGWFWSCPNGVKCIYRHALPPGFVLKKKQEKEVKEQISFEEFIETEVQYGVPF